MKAQPLSVKSNWPVFGILLALTAFAASSCAIPPLITTIADDLKVEYAHFGYLIMLQFFSFFVAVNIGGWLCERCGMNCHVLILLGLLMVAVSFGACSTVTSLRWFITWMVPIGFGGGLVEAFSSVLITQKEKPDSSKLMNFSQVFFCVGAISAPQVVAMMLYLHLSWRTIFHVFGLFIFCMAGLFFLFTRHEFKERDHCEHDAHDISTPLLKDALFIFLAIILFVYVTFESTMACWIAVYFEKKLSCLPHTSAMQAGIFWAGLICGRGAIIFIPHRYTLWPAMLVGTVIMFIASICASLTFSPSLVTVWVFLSGLGAGPLWPTTVAICKVVRNRPKFTSAVIGIGAMGVVLGSGLGSVLVKYFDAVLFFPVQALGFLVLLVLCLMTRKKV